MRGLVSHLFPEHEFPGQAFLLARSPIAPVVPGVLRRLADVLAECRNKSRCRFAQRSTDGAKPFALIVGKRVHRIQDQGPYAGLFEFARQMLPVQLEQDGIEKAFGLPAGGTSRHNDVPAVIVNAANGAFLMHIERAINQRRKKVLARSRKTLLCQRSGVQHGTEVSCRFRKTDRSAASPLPAGQSETTNADPVP